MCIVCIHEICIYGYVGVCVCSLPVCACAQCTTAIGTHNMHIILVNVGTHFCGFLYITCNTDMYSVYGIMTFLSIYSQQATEE